MSRQTPTFLDRIPGMVWFFAGMLLTSLAVGLLMIVAHRQLDHEIAPSGPAPLKTVAHTSAQDAHAARETSHPIEPASAALTMAETTLEQAPTAAGLIHPPAAQPQALAEATTAAPALTEDPERIAKRDIRQTLQAWTMAWSGKDMPAYFAQYHRDFTPPDGSDRDGWMHQRLERIANKAGRITVFLRDIDIQVDDTVATVTFIQDYDSGNYRDSARKQLTLASNGEGWQILRESTLD